MIKNENTAVFRKENRKKMTVIYFWKMRYLFLSKLSKESSFFEKLVWAHYPYMYYYYDCMPFFESLLDDQSTADICFIFKNEKNEVTERFPAHKCILARKSKFFTDLFKNLSESKEEIYRQ
ncbi:MAG: BTB/POZ domain-containing protein [Pedobacter sp.]|nr:MAG: BTB/POZ domain-containing protein [Pedobacter sp.]